MKTWHTENRWPSDPRDDRFAVIVRSRAAEPAEKTFDAPHDQTISVEDDRSRYADNGSSDHLRTEA